MEQLRLVSERASTCFPIVDHFVSAVNKQTANGAHASAERPAAPSESASALIISAADKAGMEGIDRTAIDAIILQVSGNSAFMQQQRKRDAIVNDKIAALRTKLAQRQQQSTSLPSLPQQRQFQNWINARSPRSVTVVVDMDMFFMACELLHRPDISPTTPAVVGGSSMIMTSNYAARRFGVRSAMPGYIGAALVERLSKGKEKLVFCASNFDLYKRQSGIVQSTLREYDPRHLSMLSLDEASLDISQYLLCRLQHPEWTHQQISSSLQEGTVTDGVVNEQEQLLSFSNEDCIRVAAQIVSEMRSAVVRATGGLTCSAGLAPNRLLAKIASDQNKPNGQCVIGPNQDEVTGFLHPLPIRKVSGVGRVTEKLLKAFGVTTVQQLYEQRNLVSFLFDPTSKITQFLLQASIGCSAADGRRDADSNSNSKQQQKGISRSRTFQSTPWSEVASKIEDIGCMLADDMQRKNTKAKTVSLQIKFDTYATLSRAKTLASPVWTATDLIRIALELKKEMGHQPHHVRLVGISCTNLQDPTSANQSTMDRFVVAQGDGDRTPAGREDPSVAQANPYLSPKAPDRASAATETTSIPCPVCQQRFPSANSVSNHIDACLNGAVVRKLVKEENSNQVNNTSRKKRKTSLRTYFQQSSPQQATGSL